ncbi:hypothetical protein K450DRAFT_228075 [Umbelopsis ramanniana AG]|uniref:Uncharacterized protein n=1 Tax=Umbelopsis ramanniana AG TaxID=1314678 RepID=A0AAD5EG20_UMBRA|nr:uncharacterized protein K450DRAFT_228075 [Umbelopsis ramanniana AG]KAI8582251.1 hypothetical protein K450DRAFT_228075 [Umbelopsis ramanniana AG]
MNYHDKRSSMSSYADSGYYAPSVNSTSKETPFSRTLQHTLAYYGPAAERSRASSIQSNRSKRTDEVIALPRPLTFPFHNDSYFLPVAETTHRSLSASNSCRSLVSPPRGQSPRQRDPTIDSIKPGTVRSLKQMFQRSSDTTQANEANNSISAEEANITPTSPPPKSVFTGIKEGTVKALQSLFTTPLSSKTDPSKQPPLKPTRTWKWWKRSKVDSQNPATEADSRPTSSIFGDASTPLLQPPSAAAKKSAGNRFFPRMTKPQWLLPKSPAKASEHFEKPKNPISSLWNGLKSIVKRKS